MRCLARCDLVGQVHLAALGGTAQQLQPTQRLDAKVEEQFQSRERLLDQLRQLLQKGGVAFCWLGQWHDVQGAVRTCSVIIIVAGCPMGAQ